MDIVNKNIKSEITKFESYLNSLHINFEFSKYKSVEMDLNGRINPTLLLDKYIQKEKIWYSFSDFFQLYLNTFQKELEGLSKNYNYNDFLKGLEARIYRTQLSILTEYHAFLIAKLIFGAENVFRSFTLDRKGIDFVIKYNCNFYNIHIFTDNDRSWRFRRYKSKHKKVDDLSGVHVNLPYKLSNGYVNSIRKLPNGFGVYQEKYLIYLKDQIDLGYVNNNNIIGINKDGFIYSNLTKEKQIMEYDNNNTGVLFKNETATPENKQPFFSGNCEVNGKKMQVAGWMQESKAGKKYISLKFQEPRQQQETSNISATSDAMPF